MDIRETLLRFQMKSPSLDTVDAISESWASAPGSNRPSGSRKPLGIACAALGLAALGLAAWSFGWTGARDSSTAPFSFESSESFLLLETRDAGGDNATAVVQEMRDFSIREAGAGDTVGAAKIEGVREDGLEVAFGTGPAVYQSRADLYEKFQSAVRDDLARLRERPDRSDLLRDAAPRLQEYALLGSEEAVSLLASAQSFPQLADAGAPGASAISGDRMEKLLAAVRDPRLGYRDKLIRNLAGVDHACAKATLRSLAGDPAEPMDLRVLAVEALAERGDADARTALRSLQLQGVDQDACGDAVRAALASMSRAAK